MSRWISMAALCALLAGCATSYQSSGLTGGYFEQPGPGQMTVVTFSANGYSNWTVVQNYGLYRCAELARERRKPYFVLYDSLLHAARNIPAQLPQTGWVQGKPIATGYVLFLDTPRYGSQETQEVLNRLQPVIDTGKTTKS